MCSGGMKVDQDRREIRWMVGHTCGGRSQRGCALEMKERRIHDMGKIAQGWDGR